LRESYGCADFGAQKTVGPTDDHASAQCCGPGHGHTPALRFGAVRSSRSFEFHDLQCMSDELIFLGVHHSSGKSEAQIEPLHPPDAFCCGDYRVLRHRRRFHAVMRPANAFRRTTRPATNWYVSRIELPTLRRTRCSLREFFLTLFLPSLSCVLALSLAAISLPRLSNFAVLGSRQTIFADLFPDLRALDDAVERCRDLGWTGCVSSTPYPLERTRLGSCD